jgi:hypothetical protein
LEAEDASITGRFPAQYSFEMSCARYYFQPGFFFIEATRAPRCNMLQCGSGDGAGIAVCLSEVGIWHMGKCMSDRTKMLAALGAALTIAGSAQAASVKLLTMIPVLGAPPAPRYARSPRCSISRPRR